MRKKISAILACFALMVFSCALFAQTYVPGNHYDITYVRSTSKVKLEVAGEKLVVASLTSDTALHNQTLTVRLINSDYTLFKSMSVVLPDTVFVNLHEGGVKVAENIESGVPVYYFVYNSNDGADFTSGNKAKIVRQDGVVTGFGYCSWMGFRILNVDGLNKIITERQTQDTIHYSNEYSSGWYSYQFGTSSVFDVKTGQLEHTFPRGTTVSSMEKVNGSIKYFTTNDYFLRSQDPNDMWGAFYDPTSATQYNADFTTWQNSTIQLSAFLLPGYTVYSASMFNPLIAGNTLYYLHQISYRQVDETSNYISKSYLTDQNGNILKTVNFWINSGFIFAQDDAFAVKYLPSLSKYAFINYNVVYSLPELDTLASIHSYVLNTSGDLKFLQYESPNVRILNDDFSLSKSFAVPDSLSEFASASYANFNDDDLLELAFKSNNALVVYDEDANIVVNQCMNTLGNGPFVYGPPIVMNVPGEHFGRISSSDGFQYLRSIPLRITLAPQNPQKGLYPNPAQDEVKVYDAQANGWVQVCNLTGSEVLSSRLSDGVLDVSKLKSGLYFVRGVNDGKPFNLKLIKK